MPDRKGHKRGPHPRKAKGDGYANVLAMCLTCRSPFVNNHPFNVLMGREIQDPDPWPEIELRLRKSIVRHNMRRHGSVAPAVVLI